MKGWVKLYRELSDKPIWKDSTPEQKVVLITILMMVYHDENEWEFQGDKYKCEPGQMITSLQKIAEVAGTGISVQNVRTAIKRFERYGFLTNVSTNKNRLITIVNWELYQGSNDKTNNVVNISANKQLTSNQQAANKQLTTTKNDKNYKRMINNDREDIWEENPMLENHKQFIEAMKERSK